MEFAAISVLVNYSIYIAPALLFIPLWFLLTPTNATGLRIAILLAGFVLMRDAMTPLEIWAPSATMQIAFHQDPLVLTGLGLASLIIGFGLIKMLPDMPHH